MRRQRCVAGAILEQADPVSMFVRYPQIAQAVRDNVRVSIPQRELEAWVELVVLQKGDSIRSLPVTSTVIRPASPDFEKIRALVERGVRAGAATASPSPSSTPSSSPTSSDGPSSTASPSIPADDSAAPISATC